MGRVGIVGGMGPLASCYLYERIIKNTAANQDQDHVNLIIYNNAEVPNRTDFILDNSKANPIPVIERDLKELESLGVDFIIINCNTAHSFYDHFSRAVNVPILNILEETVSAIDNKYRRIGVMATDGANLNEVYKKALLKQGFEPIIPDGAIQDQIMGMITSIKKGVEVDKQYFDRVKDWFVDNDCEQVILGCTELSILNSSFDLDSYFIDPVEIISRAIIMRSGKEATS